MRLSVARVADLRRLGPRLTAAQRDGACAGGTVLLLGRSGTGKTVCLCERMAADRAQAAEAGGPAVRQLFVARNRRLCELVRGIQVACYLRNRLNLFFASCKSFQKRLQQKTYVKMIRFSRL